MDPSSLGVDPDVKQMSGYLDDNENDKHLFYCMMHMAYTSKSLLTILQGSSNHATTQKQTVSDFGAVNVTA